MSVIYKFFKVAESLRIVNAYIHPTYKLSDNLMHNLTNLLGDTFIIMGDLNSHHPYWGSNKAKYNGRIIANIIDEKGLVILNNFTPTRLSPPNQQKSIID